MRPSDISEDRVTLLLGAPRSGTTWLGRILDSHPDVLYRHEPDAHIRPRPLPNVCPPERVAALRDGARAHLRLLMGVHDLPTSGSPLVFPKSYRSALGNRARAGVIDLLHLLGKYRFLRTRVRAASVPDCVKAKRAGQVHMVLKSVRARGHVGLLAEAMPRARIIFVLRDPMGQVAAMLRGVGDRRFSTRISVAELVGTEQARRFGLSEAAFRHLPVLEQLAWHWAVLNQKAIDELAGRDRVKIVQYHDLCTAPSAVARDMCAFLDLGWHEQTDGFIRAAVNYEGRDPNWRVYRNARRSHLRWHSELRAEEQERIAAVVRATPLWGMCAASTAQ